MSVRDLSPEAPLAASRRSFLMTASASVAVAPTAAWAAQAPAPEPGNTPSIEALMARPSLRDVALSPDGSRVAILGIKRTASERSAFVMIFDTADMAATPVAVPVGDCEIQRVDWVNDDRLLVWVLLDKDKNGETTGVHWKGELLKRSTRRIIAMGREGQDQVLLFGDQDTSLKLLRDLGNVVDFETDDPRCVLMQSWNVLHQRTALYKVDIHTGLATLFELGAAETDEWTTQGGIPVLRFDSNRFTVSVFTRAPGTKDWQFFRKFYRKETKKLDDIDFIGSTPEPGVLLAINAGEGEDMLAVRKFDVTTLKLGEIVAQRPDRDMIGCITDRARNLIACSWFDDRLNYSFTDPELAKHYRGISRYFANDCNVSLRDISRDHLRFTVYVSGPKHAGSYWIYDRAKARLEPLGAAYSGLSGARLAGMEALRLKSRDGLSLSAYLTTPATVGAKTPLVVFPHGGPEARDIYDFDPFVQALAAQGWMVLQVNFRGSSGYGRTFFKAGLKHWGDLMQNDLEDALQFVIDRGVVDEARIAICGVSYGGYAALMGAVKTPDRYRAVVSIAGDSDLNRTLAFSRLYDGPLSPTYEYWQKLIGDPNTDRAALTAASPALRAREFKAPVLLIHGELDATVAVEQSRAMRDALKAAKKPVEYVEVPAEAHPRWRDENTLMMVQKTIAHITRAFQA